MKSSIQSCVVLRVGLLAICLMAGICHGQDVEGVAASNSSSTSGDVSGSNLGSKDASALLQQAAAEYQSGQELSDRDVRIAKFSRAEQLYRQAIVAIEASGSQPRSAVYVNLGNAALQAQHIGHAIVAFRAALRLDPDHEQATQNLQHARQVVADWASREASTDVIETLFFWKGMYSQHQVQSVAALLFFAAALLFAIGVATRKALWRNLAIVPALLWCIVFCSALLGDDSSGEGVVTAREALLYSADSENAALRLAEPLPDGTEVEIIQVRNRWTEVRLAGKTGWVRSSAIAAIGM